MATTLANLRTTCKQESDMENSGFVADAEWNSYINLAYGELYGELATVYGADYFVQSPNTGFVITTDGINQYFNLPTDFFKLLGVDLQISSPNQFVSLKPIPFAERNRLSILNNTTPMAGQTIVLFYVPRCPVLANDASTVLDAIDINQWSEYIVVDACIRALAKEESDVSVLMQRKAAFKARLNSEAEARDAGSPKVVNDVTGRSARSMRYYLNGTQIRLLGNGAPGWNYGDWAADYFGSMGGY